MYATGRTLAIVAYWRTMRIAIAGIAHEALTFSPIHATAEDFRVWRGSEILEYPGVASLSRWQDIELIPVLVAESSVPSGVVERETYIGHRDAILEGIRCAGPLDAVCLLLHGAMLVEGIWSGETDLAREIRALVGREVLIGARLDLHANLSDEFANKVDLWAGYRTAPHRDVDETLWRTVALLARCIREGIRPKPVFVHLPLLLQGEKATTDAEPMRSLLATVAEIETLPGILNAELLVGFGWADAAHSGSSVTVVAQGEENLPVARTQAKGLAQAMWQNRRDFVVAQETALSADEAIDRALRASEGTVFVSDCGDNPSAGATGDVPYFLSRLTAKKVQDAVLAGIADESAYGICAEAGVGATVTVDLGGKLDTLHGEPVTVTGVVEHISQGGGPAERSMATGEGRGGQEEHGGGGLNAQPAQNGEAVATLRVGGIRVLVTSRRKMFARLEDFHCAAIDPLEHKLVVVKMGYLFPELRDIAPREILAFTPGCADMDLTRLPYRYVTRPIYPVDSDMAWRPLITNVAGYTD